MKKAVYRLILLFCTLNTSAQKKTDSSGILQIVFTSDAHYGIERKSFRGNDTVDGHRVNAEMIKEINTLPNIMLPADGGVNAGKNAGAIDYVIEGGDIANRMEIPHHSAAISWGQFEKDYIKGISLKNHLGQPAQLLIVPGNHDISDAIGFYKPMKPHLDASSMVNIYNLMMQPAIPLTTRNYNYSSNKINYSKNIDGIHFVFITLWPDSSERIWMKQDLQNISSSTPVIVFTHDQPECEAKHFTSPGSSHINAVDRFENLLPERYKDGAIANGGSTVKEQQGWISFLKAHPNIKAYFHGNSNWNQFYVYTGLCNEVALNTFRVDSPMKGKYSAKDETKLSFQVISIDTHLQLMTVRECLWNADPLDATKPLQWGDSKTVSLH
jgi:predicted MPP superfamily phosphohydrolase